MKNNIKLLGIIAVTAVIGLSLLSCAQEPEEQGVSPLKTLDIKKAPVFPSSENIEFVADRKEALDLLGKVTGANFLGSTGLLSAGTGFFEAYDEAFKAAAAKTTPPKPSETSISGTLSIDYSSYSDIAGLKITGKTSGSRNAVGVKLSGINVIGGTLKNGQGYSTARSADITFEFPLKAASSGAPARYQAGGIIHVVGKRNYTSTMKDNSAAPLVYATKQREDIKYSFVLTVVDTTEKKGAKYRFSYATKTEDARKATSSKLTEFTNLEVYNGANELKFTFNDQTSSVPSFNSTLTSLVDNVISGNWTSYLGY